MRLSDWQSFRGPRNEAKDTQLLTSIQRRGWAGREMSSDSIGLAVERPQSDSNRLEGFEKAECRVASLLGQDHDTNMCKKPVAVGLHQGAMPVG